MQGIVITLLLLIVSTTIVVSQPSPRTVTFVNQCDEDYFIAPTSAAAPFVAGVSSCHSNADCESGSSCLLANHFCYYDVPTPTSGSFSVLAGKTNSIVFPYHNNADPTHWCGNFGFCGGDMPCKQTEAICNQNGCGVEAGPYNVAEINFLKVRDDFYDISNINGVNVPMSITPSVITPNIFTASNPYQCGAPGSPTPITGLGASSWDPVVPSAYYQWVVPSSTYCSTDSDCSNGDSCGLTNVPGRTPQFAMTCGKLIGFWTADQVCGQDPTHLLQGGPFGCANSVQNGNILTTLGAMHGCSGTSGSGYSNNADASSCGCQDWYKIFGADVVPTETTNCTTSNPVWMAEILPTLVWVKEICPSCYVYPYDDMSSTFTCHLNNQGGYNVMNYTVTLCPSDAAPVKPTSAPVQPTATPVQPTAAPVKPTSAPIKATIVPTAGPKVPTSAPTKAATVNPKAPTSAPLAPTAAPLESASVATGVCTTTACPPSTNCCADVKLGAVCYSTVNYACVLGSQGPVLCAAGNGACGTTCYDAKNYKCCNNALYSISDTNAACTVST